MYALLCACTCLFANTFGCANAVACSLCTTAARDVGLKRSRVGRRGERPQSCVVCGEVRRRVVTTHVVVLRLDIATCVHSVHVITLVPCAVR